jgi:hypothetical protein
MIIKKRYFVENVGFERHPNPYPESIVSGKLFGRVIADEARSIDACIATRELQQ